MKTAELVKPRCISDCDSMVSPYNLYEYSELCSRNNTLMLNVNFAYPRFKIASYSNHLCSIKKLTKRKRAIKYKAFKNTDKCRLNRRNRLYGL